MRLRPEALDGSGHHAARAPLQRQSRLRAAGPLVRRAGCELPPIAARWSSAARRIDATGSASPAHATRSSQRARRPTGIGAIIEAARAGHALTETDIVRLFSVEGRDLDEVIAAADQLRHESVGDTVTYVVNRNINYTNICLYHCGFCAFSKGRGVQGSARPRLQSRSRRSRAPHRRGGGRGCDRSVPAGRHPSELHGRDVFGYRPCGQGGGAVDARARVFAAWRFNTARARSALPLATYLERLRDAGLSTLPGTAAEILDDEIRAIICPDKLRTRRMAERHRHGARGGSAHHVDHHVRSRRAARCTGRVI